MNDGFSRWVRHRVTLIAGTAIAGWLALALTLALAWPLNIVIALVFALTLDFVVYFAREFGRVRRSLQGATETLDALHRTASSTGGITDLDPVEKVMNSRELLRHPWEEFKDTLHPQLSDELDEHGQPQVARIRQTVPAEVYFTPRALIEGPLNTDYFRHLPGILTGLGIVGTFSGLIIGLSGFGIETSTAEANQSVETLIDAVREAFFVSAIAITVAMVITWVEKTLAARLNDDVQELQVAVDQMFDAGVDEEYLSKIADRSDQSATELGRLRQGLAEDLRDVMGALGDRLEAATDAGAQRTGEVVTAQLQGPLSTMTDLLQKSQEDQRAGVQELLSSTLEEFAGRLEEVVGQRLSTAADQVTTAADRIGGALVEAPRAMEATAVSVSDALAKSGEEARAALMATSVGIRSTLEEVSTQAAQAIQAGTAGAQATMEATLSGVRETLESASGAAADTLERVAVAAAPMATHAERISLASADLANTFEDGSRRLEAAVERLREVGTSLDAAVKSASGVATAMDMTASRAVASTQALEGISSRLADAGNAIDDGTSALTAAVEIQRAENDTRQALAEAVERSAGELKAAQTALDEFLKDIGGALEKTQRDFADRLIETMVRVHNATADELNRATKALAGAVSDLNEAVDESLAGAVDQVAAELGRLVPASAQDGASAT